MVQKKIWPNMKVVKSPKPEKSFCPLYHTHAHTNVNTHLFIKEITPIIMADQLAVEMNGYKYIHILK